MLDNSSSHSHEVIQSATLLLSSYFQKTITISQVQQLSEPDRRNLILRLVHTSASEKIPSTFILKKTVTEKKGESEQEQLSRFAHDWAGIAFLTQIKSHHAPYFYGGDLEHQFILTEDLGHKHKSLVGPLTREASEKNIQEAEFALASYMERLGKMHADTFGKTDMFDTILQNVYPNALRFKYHKDQDLTKIVDLLWRHIQHKSTDLHNEIEDVLKNIGDSKQFKVLLHGDICPDNVFFQGKELRFFDFEYSDIGHALIDGVYLRMSMPSCWCSKNTPLSVIKKMELIYRKQLYTNISIAKDDAVYNKSMVYACAYWLIWNLNRWLDELMERDWNCPSGPLEDDSVWDTQNNGFRARIISRIEAFIECAKLYGYLPQLCNVSSQLLIYLKKTWPQTKPLDLYPVFDQYLK